MSYILDALRRADAERERGAVPSLHAQPADPADDDAAPRSGRMAAVAVALGLLLAVSVAWQWFGGASPEGAAPSAAAPSATPAAEPPTQAAPPTAEPSGAVANSAPAPAFTGGPPAQVLAAPVPVPSRPAAPIAQVAPVAPVARAERATPAPAAGSAATAPAAGSVGATANAPASLPTAGQPTAGNPVGAAPPPTAELPPALRQELPKLVVGGSIYSQDPASRFVILNGQIYHERDQPAPGLVVEQIELKSAVLSYKGYRYSISF